MSLPRRVSPCEPLEAAPAERARSHCPGPRRAAPQLERRVVRRTPAAVGLTHRGRASPARRRSCPGPRRARPAARAACRTAACAPRARRGPRSSPPPPPPTPLLGCRRPRARWRRDAEPRSLHVREVPLHNRGNPAHRTAARTAERAGPGPGRGGPHMTLSATPQRCPGGRPAWPWGRPS